MSDPLFFSNIYNKVFIIKLMHSKINGTLKGWKRVECPRCYCVKDEKLF
jgi:hypothetical protein